MSISFQSTSTNTTGGSKIVENHIYSPQAGVALRHPNVLQNVAGQVIMQAVPPLMPNSALYQYNEHMLHIHDIHDEQVIQKNINHQTGRSTDV